MTFSANLFYMLLAVFGLGVLHGIVPDEHTWPITFSYSVATASGKGGMKAGMYFSLAFTVQRAIMSQIVYFAVAVFLVRSELLNGPVYVVVGLAMAIAGFLILRKRYPHFHPLMKYSDRDLERHLHESKDEETRPTVPVHWAMIHGFISGFAVDTGIFSTFIYLIVLPDIASYGLWYLGWLPGTLFGLGTFTVLMFIGFLFGEALQVGKKFGEDRMKEFGRLVGARVLFYGGIVFIIIGPLYYFGVKKMIPFEFGTLIILIIMVFLAVPVMLSTWKETMGKHAA
ncbi:MAG: hypothetical protein ACP5UZ_06200 [Thermoplasmata archaeon]